MIGLSIRTVQDMIRTAKLPYCQVTKSRRMVPSGELAARDVEGAGLAEFSSEQSMTGSVWIKERRGLLQILFCKPNEYRRNW